MDALEFQVLPHEIAVVQHQRIDEMLREIGDWVYDDGEVDKPLEDKDTTHQELTTAPVCNYQTLLLLVGPVWFGLC